MDSSAGNPRIFISYARSDSSALAEELVAGLEVAGFESYLDRHDIAAAEDWETRLGALIQSADTIVFVISPAAVKSPRCKWEVDRAIDCGKRVVPIEGRPTPEEDVPERLRRLNYIFFREGQSFAKPLGELATALRQDVEWIREHTRLGEQAARWRARGETAGAADDLLLRGKELADAKDWESRRRSDAPEITPLVSAFLAASADRAAALEDEKRKELAERERLVAEAELAQSNIRRVQRRSFRLLTGLALLVVLGTGVGLWLVYAGWRELMINRSQFLAGVIAQNVAQGGYVDAMLIALDALPDETSASLRQRWLPLEGSAKAALYRAQRTWSSNLGERQLLAGHAGPVTSVFSPDGSRVLTGSWDQTARLWDAKTGKTVASFEGHADRITAVAFSPDGARVVTGSLDKTARLWDAMTGKILDIFEGDTDRVRAVAFSPDGRRVLTGCWDGTARLWDAATGRAATILEGHTGAVTSVAFSPDGARVLTGSEDKTARLWDVATSKLTATFVHAGWVTAVALSPDGLRVLTGSNDGAARLWDAATGKTIVTLEGRAGWVTAVAFSPDGAGLLTGSDDGAARLWDAATGKMIATLEGHTGGLTSVAFSPDSARVLTGSDDGTARLWDGPVGAGVQTGLDEDIWSPVQPKIEEIKGSVPRCLTWVQRENFHLDTSPPRWCYTRHLWPYADAQPPPDTWDERLVAAWDRARAWFPEARAAK